MSRYPLSQDESSDETIKRFVYDIELGQTSYEIQKLRDLGQKREVFNVKL